MEFGLPTFKSLIEHETHSEGAGTMAMQMIILFIMFFLQLLFELVQWREMSCSTAWAIPPRPTVADGGDDRRAWDPRRDARSCVWSLCGLPSVWFSSAEARAELMEHVTKLNPGQRTPSGGESMSPQTPIMELTASNGWSR